MRLVEINHEEVRWVIGMNLLRHAYLEAAPELRPYFITGWHDDESGIMATFGARAGPGGFGHEFVTTPGVLAIIDGVLAGVPTGVVGPRLGAGTSLTLGVALLTIALLAVFHYRGAVRPRTTRRARFPREALSGGYDERFRRRATPGSKPLTWGRPANPEVRALAVVVAVEEIKRQPPLGGRPEDLDVEAIGEDRLDPSLGLAAGLGPAGSGPRMAQ